MYHKRSVRGVKHKMVDASSVITLFIAIFLAGVLLPIALGAIFDTVTTGWDATAILIWPLVGVIAIIAVIIGLIKHFNA